ncbi:hypothetical protein J2S40_002749 [Nocardioides luteus]|uniref:Uncharacterized protein n=1 Tax=Nocardioides luteus TaxID=1844 RepID=A0ABQ5T1B3_9ACTN|nr:hypothetical protein [Nocardioides luteus]MDR7311691.1 hypothetical protein [Nocardioides luteus]GGR72423.1 hypothetical protein GCM10010197_44760 [Nocardioides luteus]GLJ70029.1 hypothetical protein GCM10017579_40650 [Nocardioides luteus]
MSGVVFLHIGTRKSGTTSLQQLLRSSADALAEQSVALRATPHGMTQVIADLAHGGRELQEAAVGRLVRVLEVGPERQIISLEALAELPQWLASQIVATIQGLGYEVRVLITARHWGVAIPSEWQQSVKERGTATLQEYVAATRHGSPGESGFWACHYLPDIVSRWSERADDVSVIATPSPSGDGPGIVDLFCAEVGVDPSILSMRSGATVANRSLSLAQAEMVRRLNLELSRRKVPKRPFYRKAVRGWIVRESLMADSGRMPVRLPAEALPWCIEVTRRQLVELRRSGARIVGDEADLLCPEDLAVGTVQPDDGDVLDVAVGAMAGLAIRRWEVVAERKKAAEQPEKAGGRVRRLRTAVQRFR